MMKKVLLIANYKPGTGGISGQVEKLHAYLDKEGVANEVFPTKGSLAYRIQVPFRLLKVAKDYDVLHVHTCSHWGFITTVLGVWAGKRLKKKVVVTYHGGGAEQFFSRHPRLVKKYLCQTDANIVLSGFLGNVFDKFQIPYTVIPNIVELEEGRFCPRATIEPKFISIRTLSPLYNIECIIKAFKVVKKACPSARLTIVGDGPSRDSLEQFVCSESIQDVTFEGRVDNARIYEYLNQSDIMLSAPRIDNMPVSVLEGFNAGLLVISSNVGGVPYMIEDEVNGLLFESNNSMALAEKMMWALSHQDESHNMIDNAKEAVKLYSWECVREKIFELYNS
ncbi:MAG: glycosyltransferase family 4 protein [bacterium]|nr:glycosyltransferase family 4 protein [bacterium]